MNPKDPDETTVLAPNLVSTSPSRLKKKINQAR